MCGYIVSLHIVTLEEDFGDVRPIGVVQQSALEPIRADLEDLVDLFEIEGKRLYLVGGLVRDLLGGYSIDNDVDITTDATPDLVKRLLKQWARTVWTQGERFGTIGAQYRGRTIEITTHRSEAYLADSRQPIVEFSTAIEDDLSRRDFTVNAMAVALPDLELIDPFAGRADLSAGLLRTPLDPMVSFSDDPLRMLRAARFSAGYALSPVAGLEDSISELRARMEIVSRERIRDELEKLLKLHAPGAGLALLQRTRLLPFVVSGFRDDGPAAPFEVLDRLGRDMVVRFTALLAPVAHDSATIHDELVGLRASKRLVDEVSRTSAAWRALANVSMADDVVGARRYLAAHGAYRKAACELAAAHDEPVGPGILALLESVVDQEGLDSFRSPLDGHEVMSIIGAAAGPLVGAAISHLLDQRFEEGPLSLERARYLVAEWWSGRVD